VTDPTSMLQAFGRATGLGRSLCDRLSRIDMVPIRHGDTLRGAWFALRARSGHSDLTTTSLGRPKGYQPRLHEPCKAGKPPFEALAYLNGGRHF